MKRIISLILVAVLAFSFATFVSAEENITVLMDGSKLEFDVQPRLINQRTMVPLRKIFETFNMTVSYEEATEIITATGNKNKIVLQVGSNEMKVNGVKKTIDSPAVEINGRTLVPVRAIAESLGVKVDWDDATRTVMISSYKDGYTVPEKYTKGAIILTCEKDLTSSTNYRGWVLFSNGFLKRLEIDDESVRYTDRYVYVKSVENNVFSAASLTATYENVAGAFDKEKRTIGEYQLADNCVILDVTNIKSEGFIPMVTEVEFDRISSSKFTAKDLLYAEVDENKKVTMLILNNATKVNYSFGYLTDIKLYNTKTGEYAPYVRESLTENQAKNEQLIYSITEDGETINPYVPMYFNERITSLNKFKVDLNTPVMYLTLNNRVYDINKLQGIVNGGNVKSITSTKLTVGTVTYDIDSETKFYAQNKNGTMTYVDIESIDVFDTDNISSTLLYKDTAVNNESTIRFVIFKLK